MSFAKQFLKSRPVCKVKFALSAEEVNGCEQIFIVGEFNEWNETASPMKKQKDGSFSATLELETGRDYPFRYLCSGQWYNDPNADRYVLCSYSGENNSVISL